MGGWGGVETALLIQQCLEETKDKNINADRQQYQQDKILRLRSNSL